MIPYSIIKEVNPDDVEGSATGAINFLVFVMSAFAGPGCRRPSRLGAARGEKGRHEDPRRVTSHF